LPGFGGYGPASERARRAAEDDDGYVMAGLLPSGGYGTGSEVMRRIAVLMPAGWYRVAREVDDHAGKPTGALSEQPHNELFLALR
jgi:hypothetical protein